MQQVDPFSEAATAHEINVVPINFRKDYVPVAGKPGEFKQVHKVDLVKKGSNGTSTPWTIKQLEHDQILWPYIKPFYERWVAGQEDPEEGTPIDCLPFLPKGVIDHLRGLLILSAEDLASLNDSGLERIGMGATGWREKARMFLDAKPQSEIAEQITELRAEIDRMRVEKEELTEQVNSLVAENGMPKKDSPVKRKPGRPAKDAA